MSEFRQDIVNRKWVLIASERGRRPNDFVSASQGPPGDLPESVNSCVFCPKRIQDTGVEIMRLPQQGDWQVRVVPNKYGALSHQLGSVDREFYVSRPGVGDHEVVIVRPHNQPTALQSEELIDLTLQAYVERINDLKSHEEVRYIHVIQNYGPEAGASLVHPHSQIFATPFLPERIQDELRGTRGYFEEHGACLYCEMILHELKVRERIVLETDYFVAMTPFASRRPYQVRILPKKHRAAFQDITISERHDLAKILKEILKRIYERMNNSSYNYYFHTLPCFNIDESPTWDDEKSYHWHMVILPRTAKWAGFELGTEVYVNLVPPEEAAKFLG